MRIIGIDPGLTKTAWGLIDVDGNRLRFLATGLIKTTTSKSLAERLALIDRGLAKAIHDGTPQMAAVEETFVNRNPASALKLGQARGVALTVPARLGLDVYEYAANAIKKTVVGTGHAGKQQVALMVRTLLPKSGKVTADESDALAIAICHAHHLPLLKKTSQAKLSQGRTNKSL